MAGDDLPTAEAPEAPPSIIDRIEDFERWRSSAGRTAPVLPLAPDGNRAPGEIAGDAGSRTVLPAAWRDEPPRPSRRERRGAAKRRRPVRWTLIGLVAILAAVAGTALVALPRYAEGQAEARQEEYAAALDAVEVALPDLRITTETVTDPGAEGDARAEAGVAFARYRRSVIGLEEIADEPLPATLPLVPRDAFEELEPMRAELDLVAGRGELIAARVDTAFTYRTELDRAFALPDLPDDPDSEQVNELSLALAAATADSVDAVSRLPSDAFFAEHRAAAGETLAWFRDWEAEYTESLRLARFGRARLLADRAIERIDELRTALAEPLAELTSWVDAEIAGLSADIAAARVLAP